MRDHEITNEMHAAVRPFELVTPVALDSHGYRFILFHRTATTVDGRGPYTYCRPITFIHWDEKAIIHDLKRAATDMLDSMCRLACYASGAA